MAKHLLECSLGLATGISSVATLEYFYRFASEYPVGCNISGWSKHQWSDYSANIQVSKETHQSYQIS